jgi:hypothetical protein
LLLLSLLYALSLSNVSSLNGSGNSNIYCTTISWAISIIDNKIDRYHLELFYLFFFTSREADICTNRSAYFLYMIDKLSNIIQNAKYAF